jgi:hypothetical protein
MLNTEHIIQALRKVGDTRGGAERQLLLEVANTAEALAQTPARCPLGPNADYTLPVQLKKGMTLRSCDQRAVISMPEAVVAEEIIITEANQDTNCIKVELPPGLGWDFKWAWRNSFKERCAYVKSWPAYGIYGSTDGSKQLNALVQDPSRLPLTPAETAHLLEQSVAQWESTISATLPLDVAKALHAAAKLARQLTLVHDVFSGDTQKLLDALNERLVYLRAPGVKP